MIDVCLFIVGISYYGLLVLRRLSCMNCLKGKSHVFQRYRLPTARSAAKSKSLKGNSATRSCALIDTEFLRETDTNSFVQPFEEVQSDFLFEILDSVNVPRAVEHEYC